MKRMKAKLLGIFIFTSILSSAQTGGNNSFQLLGLHFNARSAGLGGNFISVKDKDVNMGVANASLLNDKMNKDISFSSSLLSGGINYGTLAYGYKLKDIAVMSSYIQYIAYGKMERRAVNGELEGTFSPFEMIAGSSIGRELNPRLSIGANLNFLYSQLETYSSVGASVNFSGTFHNEDKGVLVTVLAKNIGYQFKSYTSNKTRKPLPIDVQLATSYKLPHAPFRISVLVHHLNKWDLTYNDPKVTSTIDPLSGAINPAPKASWAEKLGRHFTFQLETLIGKHFDLRVGFDYQRRKELALAERPGIAGLSFGAGLKLRKFSLDYGFILYSRAGFNNMITFSTNLSTWKK